MNDVEEKSSGTAVAEFNQFEHDLAEYKRRYENVVYDLTVPEEEKRARSDRLAIGKKIAELDRVHASVKAPLKAKVDLLDGERKRIKDGLLEVQGGIKSQIEEHEAAIKEAAAALLRRASAISELAQFESTPTADVVRDRIAELKAIVIDESFGEQQGYAALNKEKAMNVLEPMLAGLEAQEREAEERERARAAEEAKARQEREAKIAAEAAEKAKQEAAEALEKAKRDAVEAAERAEREKREAVAAAEAEAARKAEAAEKARLDAIEKERAEAERREANKRHCAKINNAAAKAIESECGISSEQAKAVVSAIARGLIPAVKISY
tara:strand:- start:4344 stop:5318 length:975 start_codon:yes stop_codon:yes gene_type:complete